MAINWTMAAALDAVKENKKVAIMDLGRRFPLTLKALIETGDNSGAAIIIGALPDHITVRKIESVLKDGVQEIEEDEEQEDKPVKKEKAAKPEKKAAKKEVEEDDEEQDYSEMSARELFDLCKKRGIAAKPKQSEAAYIKLLNKADEAEAESEEDDWDEEEEEKPVAKKPVKKEASKKEEKKPAKKPAKKAEEDEEEDDDEDWDI